MRGFIISGLAALLCMGAPVSALAGDPDNEKPVLVVVAPGAADVVDPQRMELASRYLQLTITEAMNKSMGMLTEQLLKTVEDASEEEQAWTRQQFPEMMSSVMDAMVERMAPVYAERLSLEELEALVSFFDTPMGRSISRRIVEASLEQQEALVEVMLAEMVEYEAKYCAMFGCEDMLEVVPQKDRP